MNKLVFLFLLTGFTVTIAALSCNDTAKEGVEVESAVLLDSLNLIKRGDYLVSNLGGCNDCHSPKHLKDGYIVIDSSRKLSGFPSDRAIPQFNQKEIQKGLIMGNMDFTAVAGPWGTSFAANLTSDGTGIGNWSLEQFMIALKHGKYKGFMESRMLMPPMPWENFSRLSDEDIKAMFYYLKSTQPVRNIVPSFRPIND